MLAWSFFALSVLSFLVTILLVIVSSFRGRDRRHARVVASVIVPLLLLAFLKLSGALLPDTVGSAIRQQAATTLVLPAVHLGNYSWLLKPGILVCFIFALRNATLHSWQAYRLFAALRKGNADWSDASSIEIVPHLYPKYMASYFAVLGIFMGFVGLIATVFPETHEISRHHETALLLLLFLGITAGAVAKVVANRLAELVEVELIEPRDEPKFYHMDARPRDRGCVLYRARRSIVNRALLLCVAVSSASYFSIYAHFAENQLLYQALDRVMAGPVTGAHLDAVLGGNIALAFNSPGGVISPLPQTLTGYKVFSLRTGDGRTCRAFALQQSDLDSQMKSKTLQGLLFSPTGWLFMPFRDGEQKSASLLMFIGAPDDVKRFIRGLRISEALALVLGLWASVRSISGLIREIRWLRLRIER